MKKTKFKATKGAVFSQEIAQKYGEYIEDSIVKTGGSITTSAIVNIAEDRQSLLHSYFEWNNTIAGEKYRDYQARYLMNHIVKVHYMDHEEVEQRAFVSVRVMKKEGALPKAEQAYMQAESALTITEYHNQILDYAMGQIEHWQKQYRGYKELSRIFLAIKETKKVIAVKSDHGKIRKEVIEP